MKMIKSGSAASAKPGLKAVSYTLGHFLIYLGLLLVVLMTVWLAFKTYRIYSAYYLTVQHITRLERLMSTGSTNPATADLNQIAENMRSINTGLGVLRQEIRPFLPLTSYLGWLPVYGGDLEALPTLLAAGQELSRTGVILVETVTPIFEQKSKTSQTKFLAHLVTRLSPVTTELAQAQARLQQHQIRIDALDVERLSPWLAGRVNLLNNYLEQAIIGVQLARGLPAVLGGEEPRTYLILTQNSDELRPGGGYINTAGHLVFDQGQMIEFIIQDSYAVDQLSAEYPYPPAPLYEYMAADYWVLRDASWSPDFPTTARTAVRLYELGQGISADGVIAFDQQALPFLLRALEPLPVEEEQVTSRNVIMLMRRHWAPKPEQALDGEWWLQRKSFMLGLAETIHQRFEQDAETINWPVLATALQQALTEKHVLIYLPDSTWTDLLAAQNWAGALQPVRGDYLLVVDANLGFNKASALVERQLTYQISLARDGRTQAHVNLLYWHPAQQQIDICRPEMRYDPVYEQNMERCYWNYARLVVPARANLISGPNITVDGQQLLRGQPTTGEIDVAPIGSDKISWGQLFVLAPQGSRSFDYHYSLPPGTAQFIEDHWEYHLYLQKQPGTLEPAAKVNVVLPEGADLLKSQPEPMNRNGTTLYYQVKLVTDREIVIWYTLS